MVRLMQERRRSNEEDGKNFEKNTLQKWTENLVARKEVSKEELLAQIELSSARETNYGGKKYEENEKRYSRFFGMCLLHGNAGNASVSKQRVCKNRWIWNINW